MTLSQYCQQDGLDVDTAIAKLNKEGFQAKPDMTIRMIADSVGVHPSEIRSILGTRPTRDD
jgi:hypothetical protein